MLFLFSSFVFILNDIKAFLPVCPVSLQSFGAHRQQPNDHPEHRHCVWTDPDAPGAGQWQHGSEYGLPESSSGAHPQRV